MRNTTILGLMALEGIVALAAMLAVPSEAGSARFLGLSLTRVAVAVVGLAGVSVFVGLALAEWRQASWWRRVIKAAGTRYAPSSPAFYRLIATLWLLFVSLGAFIGLSVSSITQDLTILHTLMDRMGLLLLWLDLIILQAGLLIYVNLEAGDRSRFFWPPIRRMLWYTFIGGAAFSVYQLTASALGQVYSPGKAYWHLLADSFLHGRLYLVNPPYTHDLTMYNGQWYVPNPPLPALMMLPFVALFGVGNVQTIFFSIACAAINVLLVYLALEEASARGLIPTRHSGNLWLTVVFCLGTDHWWLSILGSMWFVSQILTVTFSALALLLALKKVSPWLIGLSLGLAILSRPNVFALWPFLAGIAIVLSYQKPVGGVEWRRFLGWAVQSAVPLGLAVVGLLAYNYVRFGNWLDFGYVTINGAPEIVRNVQDYGMFNVHFLPINLYYMFVKLPDLSIGNGCLYLSPSLDGISIFAMTPPIVYIFRRIKLSWWTIGAWISALLSIGILLLYSNWGSEQVGYRYAMDFILPVLLLMAIGIGVRTPLLFKVLVVLSILVSAAGILIWFNHWPCSL